jgi:hypothetical protein
VKGATAVTRDGLHQILADCIEAELRYERARRACCLPADQKPTDEQSRERSDSYVASYRETGRLKQAMVSYAHDVVAGTTPAASEVRVVTLTRRDANAGEFSRRVDVLSVTATQDNAGMHVELDAHEPVRARIDFDLREGGTLLVTGATKS